MPVASFKVPTAEERAHDFLWRIHRAAPPAGFIGILNRSHYEDVLVTRVHGQISDDEARRSAEALEAKPGGRVGTIILEPVSSLLCRCD
ncbi:MAG TPA: hypothetical protein VMU17_08000 [Elusimicrobiota bacterium]|nr:hypothetical protein [Elusimicrobiota bacterium]